MTTPARRTRRRGRNWNATGTAVVGTVAAAVGLVYILGAADGGDTFSRRFSLLTIAGGVAAAAGANLALSFRHFGYIDIIRLGRIDRGRSPRRYWIAVLLMHTPVLALLGFAIWVAITGGPK